MKARITQFIPGLLVLLVIGFRYFSNWCIDSVFSCYGSGIHQLYQYFTSPLYFFSLYLLPLAIILVFVPRSIFNSWFKLAAWAIPLLFIFIAGEPVYSQHILSTDRNDAARLSAEIFSALSLLLMIFGFVRTHLYVFNEKKYGKDYAAADIKNLPFVFAAIIGFSSTVVASWLLFSNSLSLFGLFLVSGVVSILSNIYALYCAATLSYQKVRAHIPFGWEIVLGLSFLGLTAAVVIITWGLASFVLT